MSMSFFTTLAAIGSLAANGIFNPPKDAPPRLQLRDVTLEQDRITFQAVNLMNGQDTIIRYAVVGSMGIGMTQDRQMALYHHADAVVQYDTEFADDAVPQEDLYHPVDHPPAYVRQRSIKILDKDTNISAGTIEYNENARLTLEIDDMNEPLIEKVRDMYGMKNAYGIMIRL